MQDTNVISHSMLVDRDEQGNAFTTSLVIADGTGNEHRAVLQLVKNNIKDFEEFGRVAFEMQPFKTAGGVQERKVALLNREQATLLMTYMRNNDVVRDFKKRLVRAFSEMEKLLHFWSLLFVFRTSLDYLSTQWSTEQKMLHKKVPPAATGGTRQRIQIL